MSDRWVQALVTAVAGVAILLVVRAVLGVAIDRFCDRAARRQGPDSVASTRTRLQMLRRVVLALGLVIVVWSVLEVFPATEEVARTLLASGAILALFVGVAFSVPLGNIGAGILLSLSQPARLGDRITVGSVTGVVEDIGLIHTVVRTDDNRVAFVPNSQMVTSTVVNRSLEDPRRTVSVRFPLSTATELDRARGVLSRAAAGVRSERLEEPEVLLADVGEKTVWVTLSAKVARRADVDRVAADLRERGLEALAAEQLLPE